MNVNDTIVNCLEAFKEFGDVTDGQLRAINGFMRLTYMDGRHDGILGKDQLDRTYKGMEIEQISGDIYSWASPDFDGGDIDHETMTNDPHGTGSLAQCIDQIDEHLDNQYEFESKVLDWGLAKGRTQWRVKGQSIWHYPKRYAIEEYERTLNAKSI